ncbi:MAG: AAA family ATPase, partial [Desulfobacteraceae bacterium]|nr:AAA family ATPase [Desulfobacteraceae bacterium]
MGSINIKSLISQLNNYCKTVLESAAGLCVSRSHYEITVEHVIWQMIESPVSDFSLISKYYGISHEEIKSTLSKILEEFPTGNTAKPVFSPRLVEWYKEALLEGTTELKETGIRSGTLFLSFLTKADRLSCPEITDILTRVDHEDLKTNFYDIIKTSIEQKIADKKTDASQSSGQSAEQSAIQKYCEDFTKKAAKGDIDPVFGRDTEIRQVIDIFARRRKNNPIVVGEAGVGKTAIIEGLALRITKQDVPDFLKDVSLISLDMGLLQAGASVKGEFENRLKNVINEVKASEKPIILFIDEAHTMIGAGGAAGGSDAANLLKPALARGELRTVAATTWSEYKKYFEKDAALARRFQAVYLDEPSEKTATLILRGLKQKYEQAHGVIIRDDAITAASSMSARYISGRYLPDKAIDLLDTSSARVKVLLTSKPAAVENLERKLNALNREHKALTRDKIYDV